MQGKNSGRSAGLAQWLAQVERAMKAGDTAEAARLAGNALNLGYSHAILFVLRAHSKRVDGKIEEALADLRRARDLNPRSLWALNDMADCLNALGRCAEALAAADAAIAVDRTYAKAWFQKGQAHQALRDLAKARAALRTAAELDPRFADAHARLANMAAEQSAPAEARTHALAALAVVPGHPIAMLALIAADMADGRRDHAERHLSAFLARAEIPPPLRAIAISQIGDLRDSEGRVVEAFAAYADARAVWAGFHLPQWTTSELGYDQMLRLEFDTARAHAERGP